MFQEPTESSKQPIRSRYLGHVTGYQPIRDQYFLIRSVPVSNNNPVCYSYTFSDLLDPLQLVLLSTQYHTHLLSYTLVTHS